MAYLDETGLAALWQDVEAVAGKLTGESDGQVRGGIAELTAKGHAEQGGTPTLDNPVPIQVVRGRNLYNLTRQVDGTNVSTGNMSDVSVTGQVLSFAATDTNPYYGVAMSVGSTYSEGCGPLAPVEPSTTYYLSWTNTVFNQVFIAELDETKTSTKRFSTGAPIQFTTGADTRYIVLRIGIVNATSGTTYSTAVQLKLGSTPQPYVPYGHVGMEARDHDTDELISCTALPLPSRGWVAGLPDGTADSLRLDGAGKVTWELNDAEVVLDGTTYKAIAMYNGGIVNTNTEYMTKGVNNSVVAPILSDKLIKQSAHDVNSGTDGIAVNANGMIQFRYSAAQFADYSAVNTWLSTHPITVLFPLATPVTEDCGYIDPPPIDGDCTISIPELDALNVKYFVDSAVTELAKQWYARANSEYADRITALEQAVAELATS